MMMMNKLALLIGALALLILAGTARADTHTCNSCNSCTTNISAASAGDTIQLTSSITTVGGTNCVYFEYYDDRIFDCQGYTIYGTSQNFNTYGIGLLNSGGVDKPLNNTIKNCIIRGFPRGISLQFVTNNIIINNTMILNDYGIRLESYGSSPPYLTTDNVFYNNFFNNTNNVEFSGGTWSNSWNTSIANSTNIVGGSQIGGNYWKTYSGTGYSQTCRNQNNDSFCDSSFTLDTGNVDYLPLTLNQPISLLITFVSPTPNNGTTINSTSFTANVSSNGTVSSCTLTLDGSNYSMTIASGNLSASKANSALSQGIHRYNATCDGFMTETRALSVDSVAPTIIIYSPQNITYNTSKIALNVSANETINAWWYSLNGGANTTFTPNTTITGVQGSNNIIVYANDTIGNIGRSQVFWTSVAYTYTCNSCQDCDDKIMLASAGDTIRLTANLGVLGGVGIHIHDCILSFNDTLLITAADNLTIDCNGYSLTGDSIMGDYFGIRTRSNYTVKGCYITNYGRGLEIQNYNIITNNTIRGCDKGITNQFSGSIIYNNFIRNTPTNLDGSGTAIFNTTKTNAINIIGGSQIGGNYWDNIFGTGFSKTCNNLNLDSFCDASYNLGGGNIDYLPLTYNTNPIRITSPQNTTYNNVSSVYLNVTINATISTWWYSMNGGSNTTFTPNITINIANGSNTLIVYANDSSGTVGRASISFTGNYPTVTYLNSPADGYSAISSVPISITFNCSAINDVNLANITLYLNGVPNETKSVTGIYNFSIFTKALSVGNYNWTCRACDYASQCSFGVPSRAIMIAAPPSPYMNSITRYILLLIPLIIAVIMILLMLRRLDEGTLDLERLLAMSVSVIVMIALTVVLSMVI